MNSLRTRASEMPLAQKATRFIRRHWRAIAREVTFWGSVAAVGGSAFAATLLAAAGLPVDRMLGFMFAAGTAILILYVALDRHYGETRY